MNCPRVDTVFFITGKVNKKGTGYFFGMNCPGVDTVFFITGKVACPLFPTLRNKKLNFCSLSFNDDCK